MTFADQVTAWATNEPSVSAVVLIGSHVRARSDEVWRADAQSDWDFQIITTKPQIFEDSAWTKMLGHDLHAYAMRRAAIGGVPKAVALFAGAEADFVIVSARTWNLRRWAVRFYLHRRSTLLRRTLQDLAVVVRPGWRFLKGEKIWDPFYRRVVADIGDPRLDDVSVHSLAESFVCDAVWTLRKIDRGEWLAAQRMLHRSLAETNFRLLHELRLRRGERTFPEARRAERVLSNRELEAISICAQPDAASLLSCVEKASATCRTLTHALVGNTWKWPTM